MTNDILSRNFCDVNAFAHLKLVTIYHEASMGYTDPRNHAGAVFHFKVSSVANPINRDPFFQALVHFPA